MTADDDYKIIIRPRDGLNLSSWCAAHFSDSVRKALKLSEETTAADTVQLNYSQNTILVSTPDEGRAAAYAGIRDISFSETQYEVHLYVTVPVNTAKGMVRDVSHYDTQEVIMSSLEQKDPKILMHGDWATPRRLSSSSSHYLSIIVLFEPSSHYIKSMDTIMRKDVCRTPNVEKCHKCGLRDSLNGYECKAKCAVSGGPHEMCSNTYRRRFATPPIVRQRRQQSRQYRRSRSRGRSRSPGRTRASRSRKRRGNGTTVGHPPPQQWWPRSPSVS
ncbi:hypothetical protein HPB49_008560 [Dermacentor silvarum]|uniref:Uncharacterized protein n=1 Tax=Dermacentor silvarum TaxID=543639 RepID=A0ACB8D417_DERSI|nr:hypothetical protein HPB49_008560 [Dermacentor silvarum]